MNDINDVKNNGNTLLKIAFPVYGIASTIAEQYQFPKLNTQKFVSHHFTTGLKKFL